MKKVYRIGVGLGVLLVAGVVAVVAILMSTDFNVYKDLLAEKVEEATGRKLTISGNLDLALSLTPSIAVQGVAFENAPWGSDETMIKIDELAAEVELVPLISGDVEVKRVLLRGVDILLETSSTGKGNWEFDPQGDEHEETTESPSGDGSIPVVNDLHVSDVRIRYLETQAGVEHALVLETMTLRAPSRSAPLELNLDAVYNSETVSLSGTLGSLSALRGNDMLPLKLDLSLLGASVVLDGTVKSPRQAKGFNLGFEVAGDNIADTLKRAMVMSGAGSQSPLPANPIKMSGAVRDVPGGFAIDGLQLTLGDSDAAGNVALGLDGVRPRVTADLSSNRFDVADVQAAGQSNEDTTDQQADDGRVFPNNPLALGGLKAVDADLVLSAKQIVVNGMNLMNTETNLSLKNGHLKISDFGMDFGGGRVDGLADLNSSEQPLILTMDVQGSDIDYGRIVEDMTGKKMLEGSLDLSLDAKGQGGSVRSLMAGLDGKLRVVSKKGRIDSGALALLSGSLAGVLGDGGANEIRCAVVDFDIVDGIATSKATVFETGGLSVVGVGKINLKDETLDLYFDPRAKNPSLLSVAEVGIVAGGTLKDPTFRPDAGDVVKGAAEIAAGIATGGISLLVESILDSAVSVIDKTDYCALALAGKPLRPDPAAQSESSSESAGQQPETPPAQGQNDSGDAVEGLLNSLFGN